MKTEIEDEGDICRGEVITKFNNIIRFVDCEDGEVHISYNGKEVYTFVPETKK